MEVILVALIAGVFGPSLMLYQQGKQEKARAVRERKWREEERLRLEAEVLRHEKEEADRKEVADQAARAANLLLEENKRVRLTAEQTQEKLDVIHILVNSNMTAAMQAELDATRRDLASLREVARLNEEAGRSLSDEARQVIEDTQLRISKLDAELRDRLKQTKAAEKEGRT
jgi:hypothetical protein